jgi:ribosomal protein S18 acetylase RimI-like enzyme
MITIKQLSKTSIETIHQAFEKAFADYEEPFDMTVAQLQYMIERRGFKGELSFGAFDGEELVGFTLNGIGEWNDELTAYDTGTGIIQEYRKQGIATRIFEESLPVLKKNNVNKYLLEVIKTNTKAFDLYKKAGFEVQREFDYWVSPIELLDLKTNNHYSDYTIKELDKADWDLFSSFWDFKPSWQNSADSISRKFNSFKIAGIFHSETLVGYGIIEKHTGDIPQFAIAKNYRKKGLGKLLFNWFTKNTESANLKIINTDFKDEGIRKFMQSMDFKPGFGQYEMLLKF